MEHVIWGSYGKSEVNGTEIFHGSGYKFKFRCTYSLDDVTIQSDKNYTIDSVFAIPVGFGLHNLPIYLLANFGGCGKSPGGRQAKGSQP